MARKVFEVEARTYAARLIEAGTIPQAVREFKKLLTRENGKPKRKDTGREIVSIKLLGSLH